MKIVVVGTGYVGLITGLSLSSKGNNVRCVDLNENTVNSLNLGIPTFYEEGLENLLKQELDSKRFSVTKNLNEVLSDADVVFVAVGTPSLNNGDIDLAYIEKVAIDIGKLIKDSSKFISIIIKSTVLPTTTDTFVKQIIEKYSEKKLGDFGLGMNPEFLREGSAISDFMHPDRIVIGYEDKKTKKILDEIYSDWDCEKVFVNSRTAELIKYVNNCFLALLISSTNEMANLAASFKNIDIKRVMDGVKLDKRWNPKINNVRTEPEILTYLKAGCGFGGSCLPKDISALTNLGIKHGKDMKIMKSVLEVNKNQASQIIFDLKKDMKLEEKKCLVLGLAFKAGTDDVRQSSALSVISSLLSENVKVSAHDPISIDNFKKEIGKKSKINFSLDWEKEIKLNDVVIILTPWDEYSKIYNLNLSEKIIYDARRFLNMDKINCKKYLTIGFNN